jgi:hypothetical protein
MLADSFAIKLGLKLSNSAKHRQARTSRVFVLFLRSEFVSVIMKCCFLIKVCSANVMRILFSTNRSP